MQSTDMDGMDIALKALKADIAQFTEGVEQFQTGIEGLTLVRRVSGDQPICNIYEPSICLVAQGSKRVLVGEDAHVYNTRHYLITSVHLPTVSRIINASPEHPFLGLRLTFQQCALSQLMVDSSLPEPRGRQSNRGMAIGQVTWTLLNAFQRLVRLLHEPEDIPILAPVIQREILYRLLVGEQGLRLRQIATAGSQSHQIAQAIDWMKSHYSQPLRIEDLAEQASMSTSTFHHHFRAMTALSPLQFQKQLRLREARRLMLAERLDATSAAFEVGYESPSQFSREYSRLFGDPPLRDIRKLSQAVESR